MNNLYWNIYRSLERELLDIADTIHIDDKQLSTYSMRIANLLVRTVIEIESISKELYFREGGKWPPEKGDKGSDEGSNADRPYPLFDINCLKFLEQKWTLRKKVVIISSPRLYVTNETHVCFRPLNRASEIGKPSWKKAYQAVKHNRAESLSGGNIMHFIQALGALFLLNLYYQDQGFDLGGDVSAKSFDVSLGSSLFSIEFHPFSGDLNGNYTKKENYEQCTYLVCPTQESQELFQEALQEALCEVNKIASDRAISSLQQDIESLSPSLTEDERNKKVKELEDMYHREYSDKYFIPTLLGDGGVLSKAVRNIKYEVILNKNQH